MIEFIWPWAFLGLIVPVLARLVLKPHSNTAGAVRIPMFNVLTALTADTPTRGVRRSLAALLLWLIWALVIGAVARPTWVGEPLAVELEKRDMLLAVDISRSMAEQDMRIDQQYVPRLHAVKSVVGDFIEARPSDRLGLILFGERAFLQTPLTFDRRSVSTQLKEAQLGFAGNATAIGDAIGVAIKRLRDRSADSRVLILLTDGANTGGTDPRQAAQIAQQAGIKIYTIGIGASAVSQRDFFGRLRSVNPSADLDEDTLRLIATRTGGEYFRAEDPAQLNEVYQALDTLEPIAQEELFRPKQSLSHWLLLAALVGLALLVWAQRRSQT